jgi:CDP-paratose 2-epimerase
MKNNYLITGGCGFVGSNIASTLIKRGEKVVLLDNLSRIGSDENLRWLQSQGEIVFIHADTSNAAVLKKEIKESRPDIVFHLAGQVAMTTSVADPIRDFQTNVVGTVNLLEAVRDECPEASVLYSSSNKVYGALGNVKLREQELRYSAPEKPYGIGEDALLDFRTPYGCSKGAADQYVLEYSRTYGIKTVVFRHSTIYGGRQHSTYDQGWVGWFCQQALAQKNNSTVEPFTISGDGKQVRDLLYVSDAVDCYLAAAEQIDKVSGNAFNIGGGVTNSSSLLELFEELEKLLGLRLRFTNKEWRHEDQKYFVADCTKMTNATGWVPQIRKEEGIKRTLDWSAVVPSTTS